MWKKIIVQEEVSHIRAAMTLWSKLPRLAIYLQILERESVLPVGHDYLVMVTL